MFSALINSLILLSVGIVLLIGGAELLIRQVQYLAQRYNISPLVLGAILLGFGTSLPEIVVSVFAVINETPLVAYGNAIGSNLLNIGIIFGLAACVSSSPLVIKAQEARISFVFLGLSIISIVIFASDMILMPYEAAISFLLFICCMYLLITANRPPTQETNPEITPNPSANPSTNTAPSVNNSKTRRLSLVALMTILGLAGVAYGGEMTVKNAYAFAYELEVPEQVISLLLVAFGTSLPELVVTIQLAMKKETSLIIGNILGSNIFNVLLVLPIAYALKPLHISLIDLYRDGAFMIVLTLILIALGFAWKGERRVHRKGGALMIVTYCIYFSLLIRYALVA